MPRTPQPIAPRRVGVVGAGQLARMMGEAALDADVRVCVLASSESDCAVATCDEVIIGPPNDRQALEELARRVDVITFDHELLDLNLLRDLETSGVVLRPSSDALRYAVDKAFQRQAFHDARVAVPRFLVVASNGDPRLDDFLDELGRPPVIKAARGGYDGRGVAFPASRDETLELINEMSGRGVVVVEERFELLGEVAQLVARTPDGSVVLYPVVSSVQRNAQCVEVRYPSNLDDAFLDEIGRTSEEVARLVGGVGIMAVEYFVTPRGLFVNEIALRPHNTGHWTIEGASTSQFVQHLRCVSGQDLCEVTARARCAVMVNVVGGDEEGSLDAARAVAGAFVHDYGKSWRRGRKLGHVTALGDDPTSARVRAWTSARAYGTATREA